MAQKGNSGKVRHSSGDAEDDAPSPSRKKSSSDDGTDRKKRSARQAAGPGPSAQSEKLKRAFLYATPVLIVILLAAGIYVGTLPDAPIVDVHVGRDFPAEIKVLNDQYRAIGDDYHSARGKHDDNQKRHVADTQDYMRILADLRGRCADVITKLGAVFDDIKKIGGPENPEDMGLDNNVKALLYEIRHDPG